jgi:L-amino acid N-acyltransferase YncA
MTLPNPASEGSHEAMGFEPVGVFTRVGWKLGSWHDSARAQRDLDRSSAAPIEPG